MGFASVFSNGVQTPLKFESCFLRVSPFSPTPQAPRRTRLGFTQPHTTLFSAGHSRGAKYSQIARSNRTEQDDGLSTSEGQRTGSQSYDDSGLVDASHTIPLVDNLDGKKSHDPGSYNSSVRAVALWVCIAVVFGIGVGFKDGVGRASEFFAGYLLEQSLSVDNLFVFVLIFKYFKVPIMYQSRVLSYGIAGAVIFRLSVILLGTATLQRFEAVNLLLAVVLLYSSLKLFADEEEDTDLSNNFLVKTCQKFIPVTSNYDGNRFITLQDGVWKATPLLLTVAVVELSDIAFAVDSIPAVFGVTRDPFIVFTSNLFAILGLRSLYSLVSESMSDLEYLQPSIGVVLGFIGFKMILDYFGYHVSTEVSLGFVAVSLSTGVLLSLMKKSD
ncbi:thylakoid membrane protein TERC, chloroplastic [Malania oleifera]|uniref:thylakoid membrane protein TERC, chloroplastic n=1 Tax=Malania oleifera TaxID=397392 RepID=UPI0025AE71CF|nr:thylakoid membrane protein TERC, chloroplastic [Malania oleifera]XP_057983999.1 thylakoid membrane protein TERC, chloroplastic [Malania oleifera]XP_057984000.1 thylakoid membrane protein TERC, chloroplastic [Malania oleifera]